MSTFQHFVPVQGNLTDDPELRFTNNGTPVANFTLAFNPSTFNRDTRERERGEAVFLSCTAWGKLAEGIAAHPDLVKGRAAVGYASMTAESWDDRNGGGRRTKTVYRVEVLGPDVTFYADDLNGGRTAGQYAPQGGAPAQAPQQGGQADPWAASAAPQQGRDQQGGGQWGGGQQGGGGGWGAP